MNSSYILQNHLIQEQYQFIFSSELYNDTCFISTLPTLGIAFTKKLLKKVLKLLKLFIQIDYYMLIYTISGIVSFAIMLVRKCELVQR